MKLLFVCSRNQWRSPTAEQLWRRRPGYEARSAGTSPKARRTVTTSDVVWADVILVMENKHRQRLRAEFGRLLEHKPLYVLDIADEYQYMDATLIEELEARVAAVLPAESYSPGLVLQPVVV
ncbi:phosphotyrosine protein phosphatase [Pokkaliibacter sp. MBI-7]|uniref:low molecular weight protein tyrosine phosphatase family protein n=1 Tax=Pokkaliibacter sp. MBI-7 TaxID=3040600 RepID=UPI00244B7D23|nr:phosphotyrosine protein phosphatase [Pokkaliibacter sp. MBI-7]MDH2432586.1 phosphotyrosine protein phosphatase [Pokkaliibacter sp. MBI-7]